MKNKSLRIIITLLFLGISSVTFGQDIIHAKVKVTELEYGYFKKYKYASIDKATRTLTVDDKGEDKKLSFDQLSDLEYKSGSFMLEGVAVGLSFGFGLVLVNQGSLRPIVSFGVMGLIIGALIPKYKTVDISKDTKLSMTPTGLKLSF